jgi:heat shock protein HslJ
MVRVLLSALLPLLVLAGCASAAPTAAAVVPPTAVPAPDPAAMVGWWRVAGTGQPVLIDPTAIEIRVRGYYYLTGAWRADQDGRLVVHIDSVTEVLPPPGSGPDPVPDAGSTDPAPPWQTTTAGFRIDGADRVLLDRAGAPTARLVPAPATAGFGSVDPARPAGGAERHGYAPAAPVAGPLRPADPAELVGRWVPDGSTAPAFVEFADGGRWTGSDGCNTTGGGWAAGADGGFLATAPGPRTLVACAGGVDVGPQLGAARRTAVDGAELVVLDVDGGVVGRFRRG